jgi:hypothetical protein
MKKGIFYLFLTILIKNSLQVSNEETANKTDVDFMNHIDLGSGGEQEEDKRSLGEMRVIKKDDGNYLRIAFSDEMRIPEIHLEKNIPLEEDQNNPDFIKELAKKEIKTFIENEDNFRKNFEILEITRISFVIEQFVNELIREKDHIELKCSKTSKDNEFYFSTECRNSKASDVFSYRYEIILKNKYYRINIESIEWDQDFIVEKFIGEEMLKSRLEKIFSNSHRSYLGNNHGLIQFSDEIPIFLEDHSDCKVSVEIFNKLAFTLKVHEEDDCKLNGLIVDFVDYNLKDFQYYQMLLSVDGKKQSDHLISKKIDTSNLSDVEKILKNYFKIILNEGEDSEEHDNSHEQNSQEEKSHEEKSHEEKSHEENSQEEKLKVI